MRVVMVGQRGVQLGPKGSGVERHVAELAPRLAALEHDVTVFCRTERGQEQEPWLAGVRLRYLPGFAVGSLATVIALFQARGERPDIVHFHGVRAGAYARLARWLMPQATVVLTYHGEDEPCSAAARWRLRRCEQIALRQADYCIVVAHHLQLQCRERFGVQTIVIPNGAEVRPAPPHDVLQLFDLQPGQYVLAVARHVPQKGLYELIAAFRGVPTTMRLVIVGAAGSSRAYEEALRALAAQDRRVQFVGYQEGAALAALYAYAYCFVHPSHAEGLSVAVLEAMSYGTAPLVAHIEANIEAVDGAGFTFPVGDVMALQQALAQVLAQPDEVARKGTQARRVIAERYTWQQCAERTLGVYRTARH